MLLPKAKNKKLIKQKEFLENAKRVKKSFEEELKYLLERKLRNGNHVSSHTHSFS